MRVVYVILYSALHVCFTRPYMCDDVDDDVEGDQARRDCRSKVSGRAHRTVTHLPAWMTAF